MGHTNVNEFDITMTNEAVQALIEVTENPHHRYLLQAYDRHRNLEHNGYGVQDGPADTIDRRWHLDPAGEGTDPGRPNAYL